MAQHHFVVPQTIELSHSLLVAGTEAHVVVHALIPDGQSLTVALVDAVFTQVKALWVAQFAPLCAPSVSYFGIRARDLRQEGMPIVSSTGTAAAGTATGVDTLPRQLAACLTLRTNRAGRKYRGRMYWTGFAESANGSDNHMATAMKTAADAFAAGFITASNQSGTSLAVTHRPTEFDDATGLPIAPGLGFSTAVTQVVCRDNIWDNQRRRSA